MRMNALMSVLIFAAVCGAQRQQRQQQQEPKQAFQKVCGACHPPDFVMTPRSKEQWDATIQKMTTLGAKGTDQEFAIILDYLVKEYGRAAATNQATIRFGIGAGPGSGVEAGAKDKHIVDEAAADRGRKVWAAECIDCHGTQARGSDKGANLIRSELVLRDRYGSEIGPFLRKGHPTQSGSPSAELSQFQIEEVSHFIHLQVYDTLRSAPVFRPHDVVTGDAKAGAAFFNGEGKCATCHSPSGDLAGIGSRYAPAALQGRVVAPRFSGRGGGRGGPPSPGARRQVTLTVTPPSGPEVTGTPVVFDDFNVAIRDAAGEYHSWTRTPALKVVKNDPYAAHDELLEKYTDQNMHDIVAYLVTLK